MIRKIGEVIVELCDVKVDNENTSLTLSGNIRLQGRRYFVKPPKVRVYDQNCLETHYFLDLF